MGTDILSRVRALNLPKGEYSVFGSGVLEIRNIRKAKDVDILVTESLYKKLKSEGWKRKWFFWRTLWAKCVTNGDNEAFTNLYWAKKYRPNTTDVINRAEMCGGIPFLTLQDYMEFLRHLPRKKDKWSLKLIEGYLKDKN